MFAITQYLIAYLPSDVSNLVVSYFGNVIIAIGEDTSVSAYDASSKRWMPLTIRLDLTDYVYPTLVNIESKIYVFEHKHVLKRHSSLCYNLLTGDAALISILPCVNNYVVLNQSIYAIDEDSKIHQLVDGNWHYITIAPNQYAESASVAFNGQIFIIGGHKDGKVTNQVHTYNPITKLWSYNAMNCPRYMCKIGVLDKTLHVINVNSSHFRQHPMYNVEDMHAEKYINEKWELVSLKDVDIWCDYLIELNGIFHLLEDAAGSYVRLREYDSITQEHIDSHPRQSLVMVNSYFLS